MTSPPTARYPNGRVFYDLAGAKEQGIPDGMKVDSQGNVYAAGPEGVWVFSPDGRHIGTIQPGETAANLQLGRRRQDAVHHRQHQRLPDQGHCSRRRSRSIRFTNSHSGAHT